MFYRFAKMLSSVCIAVTCTLLTYSLSAQMVIGGATPAASAVLDLQSTSKGLLPPRLSSLQRNAIASPAQGLTIYNSSLKLLEVFNGTLWVNASSGTATGCGAKTSSTLWRDFLCYNLGADMALNPFTPQYGLVGNYYQWGRNPHCFGQDGVDDDNPCQAPVYGALGAWGTTGATDNAEAISNWNLSDAPTGSWLSSSGVKTAKDPCPAGYRVPTRLEWDSVRTSNTISAIGTWSTSATNYSAGILIGSLLFLPACGYRDSSDGKLFERGSAGYYWSSTENASNVWGLKVENGSASTNSYTKNSGFSVRCIKE